MMKQMGEEGFRWFFAIAEDVRSDEYKLYRVKIRVLNEHDDLQTDDLPWATVLLPTTSSTYQGSSDTPAITAGTMVFGFFADGNQKQMPVIIGTIPIFPDKDENKHSLSMLARGKQTLEKTKIGPEPDSAYAAEYPYNRVITSRAGHVMEIDDTPDAERIHVYHKSGSYVEINKDGRVVIKANSDCYVVTNGQQNIYVDKDASIVVKGNTTIDCKNVKFTGDVEIQGEATIKGIEFSTHVHTNVQSGSSETGKPK